MKNKFLKGLVASIAFAVSGIANAGLILSQTDGASGNWDLGSSGLSNFMPIFNAQHTYSSTFRFDDLTLMNSYDALWLNDEFYGGGGLTGAEINAITTFISSGHKAVAITDNQNWANWNDSLELLLSASITDQCVSANGTANSVNSLTNGAPTLFSSSCNSTINQTPNADILYSNNMAALYSMGQGSILLLSSVDILNNTQNAQFSQNIVNWLAEPIVVNEVPEPSTLAIFALSLMGLASRKFKKQA